MRRMLSFGNPVDVSGGSRLNRGRERHQRLAACCQRRGGLILAAEKKRFVHSPCLAAQGRSIGSSIDACARFSSGACHAKGWGRAMAPLRVNWGAFKMGLSAMDHRGQHRSAANRDARRLPVVNGD